VDHRRAAVGGDVVGELTRERVLDLADALRPAERVDDVADGRLELRVLDGQAVLALDEHGLGRDLGEAGGLDDLVAALGLSVAHVLVGELLLADHPAEDGREDHEGEPAEDRLLAMLRAPPAGARSEVAGLHVVGRLLGRGRDVPGNVSELPAAGPPGLRGLPVSCGAASLTGRWGWPRACVRAG
jgi:hypothetical protein